MNRLSLLLALALAIALGCLAVTWQSRGAATLRADAAEAVLAQARRHSVDIDKASKAAEKRINKLEVELNEALRQNRAWADTRVPDAVRDSLCRELSCTNRTK